MFVENLIATPPDLVAHSLRHAAALIQMFESLSVLAVLVAAFAAWRS